MRSTPAHEVATGQPDLKSSLFQPNWKSLLSMPMLLSTMVTPSSQSNKSVST